MAKKVGRRRAGIVATIVLVALALVVTLFAIGRAQADMREQGAAALRQSILDAAVRCCAVEGSYPLSLSHLEECYGLRINHDDYIVTYEAFASNIPPSVAVVPR